MMTGRYVLQPSYDLHLSFLVLCREYEEVKLPGQQFGDVPTQKCEAYGMFEMGHPVIPSQDPLYEHVN